MQALGFEMDYYDEYHNALYEVFDAVPNNVLYGIDGNLYFIDTQIRLREWHKKKPQTLSASLELSPIIWFQIFLVGDMV